MSLRKLATTFIAAAIVAVSSSAALGVETSAAVSPGQVLISDSQGMIFSYDIRSGALEEFAEVTSSNFDISYTGPNELLIANIGEYPGFDNGALYTLDLTTRTETLFVEDDEMTCPGDAAFAPQAGGVTYIADICSSTLYELTAGSTTPEPVAPNVQRVEVDKRGVVYFTNNETFGRLVPGSEPQILTTIEGGGLNSFALTPKGVAYLTNSNSDNPAVYKVDMKTGDVLATYTSQEFRNPGDVAVAANGDVYVVDSAWEQDLSNHVVGLYRIPANGGEVEILYQNDQYGPLWDPVFILLTPFQGF